MTMTLRRIAVLPVLLACLGAVQGVVQPAAAQTQSQAFENFFISVCNGGGAVGNLATTCGAALPNGALSGDSEQSVNPTQTVSKIDAAISKAKERTRALLEEMEAERDAAAGRDSAVETTDDVAASFGRWSVFFNVNGSYYDQDITDPASRERSFDGYSAGVDVGADYRLNDRVILGGVIGYTDSRSIYDADEPGRDFVPQDDQGSDEIKTVSVTGFGSMGLTDNLFVDGTAFVEFSDMQLQRKSIYQDTNRGAGSAIPTIATGETDGMNAGGSLGLGYDVPTGSWTHGVYTRANYTFSQVDSYSEEDTSGNGVNLTVDVADRHSLTGVLGFRTTAAISTDFGVVVPQARIEVEKEFILDSASSRVSYVNDTSGQSFNTSGDAPDSVWSTIGLGVAFVFPNGWSSFIDGEAVVGYRDNERYAGTIGLRKEF